ncbi:hypothetical protein [uncultured Marivirga sp.]|uniref:hypothetical protein n=1 Tax=uncultured Marivirga sp. TaxID=1123707 RepID=UPI0030EF4319|tara:strand:+ start:187768 stop:188259 length:492 start_codon:yes stop_codon:yes gene_type:complete
MDIDQDYLTQLFDGDQIYVFQEESDTVEYKVQKDTIDKQLVKEPKNVVQSKSNGAETQKDQKEVVILLKDNLGRQEKETLNKLLRAINIEEGQYEIIHEHPEQLKLVQHLKLFLSFHNQYVQSSEYSILKINKGSAIYAHDLVDLNQDTSKKLMLWNLLKTIV